MTVGGTDTGAPRETLLSFAVPDDLLREAVAASDAEGMIADLELMPGVGTGKPPPMLGILRKYGWAPVTYLTLAAFIVAVLDSGFGVLAPDIQRSFHINDAELGAAVFAASAAQIGVGLPVALASDRGSRVKVAFFCLLVFGITVPLQDLPRASGCSCSSGSSPPLARRPTRRRTCRTYPTGTHQRREHVWPPTNAATSRSRARSVLR